MEAEKQLDWSEWEERFAQFLEKETGHDPAHDRGHVLRVVANAKKIAAIEGARLDIVIPAAWLHDCVILPKNSELRQTASVLAARRAAAFLKASGFHAENIPAIEHAIAAHSFSANIEAETLEAKVVQDADRLDAIGAIGIARCFAVGGALQTQFYHLDEPFPIERQANDRAYVIDHFYVKLFTLVYQMGTETGRQEAEQRTTYMQQFLSQLGSEIGFADDSERL